MDTKDFMSRHRLSLMDVVFILLLGILVVLLAGANIARREIEARVLNEQRIYVTPSGDILVTYRGEQHTYTQR